MSYNSKRDTKTDLLQQEHTLLMEGFLTTWEDEEDSRNEGQDGALRTNVTHVTDDEGHENEE